MEEALNHPKKGGLGYPVSQRAQIISNYELGQPIPASKSSISRWRQNLHPKGRKKGMKRHLKGEYLELLKLYRLAYPKAYLPEVSNFIFQHSSEPRIFHPSMISKAEAVLNITRKRGTTVARQQLTPEIAQRREAFFNQPPPLGIQGVPLEQLLDIDESGWSLQRSNRDSGKAYKGIRVVDKGNYSRTAHWNLILAICGDGTFKYGRISPNNTDTSVFYNYLTDLLSNLPKDRHIYFLWDNLSVHNHPHISNLIHTHGHTIIPRPPYSPEMAPIELVFNYIEQHLLSQHYFVQTEMEFIYTLQNIIGNLNGFRVYFNHCGYN